MNDRREQIVQMINREGAVSFAQLKQAFSAVSEMTLRSDLKALDESHSIVRVHGGAKSVDCIIGNDDMLNRRTARNAEQKRQIARKAVKLLTAGTSLFLDSGSTAAELARCIPDEPRLIATTGLPCAMELARLKNVQVYMLGGTLNSASLSVHGAGCCAQLADYYFEMAFLGVSGYMEESGFTCGAQEESELKKTVLRHAEQRVLLMDSSKVGLINTFTFSHPEGIDILISDDGLDEKTRALLTSSGVRVL